MTTPQRTWDDLTHAERAAQHRANAAMFRQQKRTAGSPLDPADLAAAEDRAAEVEDALAALYVPGQGEPSAAWAIHAHRLTT